MNNASILSLNGKEVTMVAYAANRTDEVPGVVSISGDINTIPEETAELLARRLGVLTMKIFSVNYGRTGVYDATNGYRMDIRFKPSRPTHWLCIAEQPMKSMGGPLEIDYIDFGDGIYALVIPVAKAENILAGRLARGWDPLLV